MKNTVISVIFVLLYFVFLTALVTMGNSISTQFGLTDEINSSGGMSAEDISFTPYADNPRFRGTESFLSWDDPYDKNHDATPKYLMKYGYIYDNATCESYNGFQWVTTSWLVNWLAWVPDYNCEGKLNLSYYDDSGTFDDFEYNPGQTQAPVSICHLSSMNESKQLSKSMGCTWYDSTFDLAEDTPLMLWISLKQIATLDVDFGIENDYHNFLFNLLLTIIPLLFLTVLVIVLIREYVGFT